MSARAAITVHRSREEVEPLWAGAEQRRSIEEATATLTFRDAPGDRGTEIHVELAPGARGGALGEALRKLTGSDPLARVKDNLRRFKQRVETGEIPRSDATPEGEQPPRKLKQRPAQPLDQSEREKAGAR